MARLFRPVDIDIISANTYENPFLDVDVTCTFIHRDTNTSIFLSGFWKKDNVWTVRFAPTLLGVWDYTVTSNDASLCVSGTVDCITNDGITEIDRRGFVRIRENSRFFEYSDGTPFYWLGDTHWQSPDLERLDECNCPGCECGSMFKHSVDKRAAQGYNVFQTYPSAADNDGGGGKRVCKWWSKPYTVINPDSFNENFDKKMEYLLEKGFTVALGFGVHCSTPGVMGHALKDFARYVVARYAAYPIIWILGQEVDMPYLHGNMDSHNCYLEAAETIYKYDGYRHPSGTHMCATPYDSIRDNKNVTCSYEYESAPWHNFWALQQGHHNQVLRDLIKYEDYYLKSKKPYVETECYYEDLSLGGPDFNNFYGSARNGAWMSNLCGSVGFTYGVQGVWGMRWSKKKEDGGWVDTYNCEPWYMGLEKPGGYEMVYMKEFFENVDFTRLTPAFYSEGFATFSDREKAVMAHDGNSLLIVYLYGNDKITGSFKRLRYDKIYKEYWFDPRCGKYIYIGEFTEKITHPLPARPDNNDWIYVLTYEDIKTEKMGELYKSMSLEATVGSKLDYKASTLFSFEDDGEKHLNDGTLWRPFANFSSTVIDFKLENEKKLSSIKLHFEKNISGEYSYRVYGVKGNDLTVLTDRIAKPSVQAINIDELRGSFDTVRVLFVSELPFINQEERAIAGIQKIEIFGE